VWQVESDRHDGKRLAPDTTWFAAHLMLRCRANSLLGTGMEDEDEDAATSYWFYTQHDIKLSFVVVEKSLNLCTCAV
jgi:hypothetical protein